MKESKKISQRKKMKTQYQHMLTFQICDREVIRLETPHLKKS